MPTVPAALEAELDGAAVYRDGAVPIGCFDDVVLADVALDLRVPDVGDLGVEDLENSMIQA